MEVLEEKEANIQCGDCKTFLLFKVIHEEYKNEEGLKKQRRALNCLYCKNFPLFAEIHRHVHEKHPR